MAGFDRKMEVASRKATADMRVVLRRAIASGAAKPTR
jgi:hypothetical protein